MTKARMATTTAMIVAWLAAAPAFAQDNTYRTLRFGYTSGWNYDGRDDDRDFPTNGFFPGNFAADPANAAVGAAGIFGSNPWRSAAPYPSQGVIRSVRVQAYCTRRYRSYDPSIGSLCR